MRRFLAVFSTCLLLAGCASTPTAPTLPPGSNGGPVDAYADAADKVMDRAAASVVVAKEATASGNPKAAAAELTLAEAILPRPSPAAVSRARVRAQGLSPEEYEKAAVLADKAQRDLEQLWAMVEKEKGIADAALAQHQADLDAKRDLLLTSLGGLIILASLAAFFWGTSFGVSKSEAIGGFLLGAAVAVIPHVMANEYAGWAIGAAAFLAVAKLGHVLFIRRTRCAPPNPYANAKAQTPPQAGPRD